MLPRRRSTALGMGGRPSTSGGSLVAGVGLDSLGQHGLSQRELPKRRCVRWLQRGDRVSLIQLTRSREVFNEILLSTVGVQRIHGLGVLNALRK